jgi:hypothetical protein
MNSFLQSKAMAKALRQSLAERNIELSHSACLELVSRQFGFSDWNVLSAQVAAIQARQQPLAMPDGWFPAAFADTKRYRIGLDETAPGCALIECLADRNTDLGKERFACMMQSIDAQQYRGKKLKLTAVLRSEDAGCGTIWLRVDGIENRSVRPDGYEVRSIRFDNMTSRKENGPISGTTGWTSRSIVLDVPIEASSIHYGFFLRGYGKVWAKHFKIEVVSEAAPVTAVSRATSEQRPLPIQPSNLDFTATAT